MNKSIFKSKTFWGGVVVAVAKAVAAPAADRPAAIVEGLGYILGAVGVRTAIAANGTGQ